MSKLHDPDLLDSEKPLYVFEQEVICDRLINALESFHALEAFHIVEQESINPYYIIQLVPSYNYFISYLGGTWVHSEKIYVTQEQIDKYLVLFDSLSMPFLEYMEILHEG